MKFVRLVTTNDVEFFVNADTIVIIHSQKDSPSNCVVGFADTQIIVKGSAANVATLIQNTANT